MTFVALDGLSLGLGEEAYVHAVRAKATTERFGIRLLSLMAYAAAAVAAAECGHSKEARDVIDETEAVCRAFPDAFYAAYSMALACRAARLCGDYERARTLGLWSLEHTSLLGIQATAGAQLANVALAMGDAEGAYARCAYVIEMTRKKVVRGGFDLDLWEALVRSLRLLKRPEAERAAKRAQEIIASRAEEIDDPVLRQKFLESRSVKAIEGAS
jgi:hypothetical protein